MHRIEERRVVPVVTIAKVEDALPIASALIDGGLDIIEITLRTDAALPGISEIVSAHSEMLVGAGTILTIDQLAAAKEAGAAFGVAPGLNETVVKKASDMDFPFVPGVVTASEIERALSLGCHLQKFFPAELIGGAAMLKVFTGPYAHTGLKFIPLGSVNMSNAPDYLRLPIVAAIGGSWLVSQDLVEAQNWSEITNRTKIAIEMASSIP